MGDERQTRSNLEQNKVPAASPTEPQKRQNDVPHAPTSACGAFESPFKSFIPYRHITEYLTNIMCHCKYDYYLDLNSSHQQEPKRKKKKKKKRGCKLQTKAEGAEEPTLSD